MNSFTKDIINKPNIVVGKFQKKRNKSGQVKVKKEDYYIYQYKLFSKLPVLFYKVAGGVGCKIYEYLIWKEKLNGRDFITLPNEFFLRTWGIRRQRINDACKLLEAQDLIVVRRQKGFSNYVKLNVEFENEK
tara:strand:+ start:183 stop:578 length:396 start_codon:yes stop_codon:yes gene_type:complete